MCMNLRNIIDDAYSNGYAIGHFNVSNSTMLEAVWQSAKEMNKPVIIGASEGERDSIGIERIVAMIASLRQKYNYPIFLNADHTYSVERVKEAIDAGFDSVIFDGAKLSLEENIEQTKECVRYAKASGKDVLVEGELGFIGQSSKMLDELPEGAEVTKDMMTKPETIARYTAETNVDLVAPAIGNVHGMLKNGMEPSLNIELVKDLNKACDTPMVLHGGSGNNEADVKGVIRNGVAIVHVSTELRLAYRKGLESAFAKDVDEIAPYKYEVMAINQIKEVVKKRLSQYGI